MKGGVALNQFEVWIAGSRVGYRPIQMDDEGDGRLFATIGRDAGGVAVGRPSCRTAAHVHPAFEGIVGPLSTLPGPFGLWS